MGEYDLAYSEFLELGTFKDAEDMLKETRYIQAVKYRENRDFEFANTIFESLGNYKDSEKLIHIHDYKTTSLIEATCTTSGTETLECSGCKDSYVNYITPSHNYIVTNEIDSTCTSSGSKEYKCSLCNHTYSEPIALKNHHYTVPTCTTPQKCSQCDETFGTALGHTDSLICTRCGVSTFETLKFSGRGVGNITNIKLPKGKYHFTFTHSGYSNFVVYYYNGASKRLIVNEIGNVSYVHSESSVGDVLFGEQDRYFNITMADGNWTLTIEAVGN